MREGEQVGDIETKIAKILVVIILLLLLVIGITGYNYYKNNIIGNITVESIDRSDDNLGITKPEAYIKTNKKEKTDKPTDRKSVV